MSAPRTAHVGLAIGAVMAALGAFLALRLLVFGAAPVTGQSWLDIAFAFFFVARGALQFRRWRQATER